MAPSTSHLRRVQSPLVRVVSSASKETLYRRGGLVGVGGIEVAVAGSGVEVGTVGVDEGVRVGKLKITVAVGSLGGGAVTVGTRVLVAVGSGGVGVGPGVGIKLGRVAVGMAAGGGVGIAAGIGVGGANRV